MSSTPRTRKARREAVARGDCACCTSGKPRNGNKTCGKCIRICNEAKLDRAGKSPRELMRWADDGGRV